MKRLNTLTRRSVSAILTGLLAAILFVCAAQAQTTAFTYQGRLTDGTTAANGTYDLGFALYDAETGGNLIGTAITRSNVTVSGGIFTVQLDFSANAFAAGANRFLQIAVKKTTEADFITLTPRQPLTSSPYSIRTISAGVSDALSTNCVGCVTNAQINSVAGSKVTGTVANATTATTAGNVSGVVAIANGGTGSSTQNFVDLSNAQTVGGNKTFSNTVSANTLSAGSGGLNMNNNILRLRDGADNNHGMIYSSVVDGPEFRAFGGFRWANGTNGANQRMLLNTTGLTVNGNITSTGTISGTLANNSVGGAQVTDGSLRITDSAIVISAANLSTTPVGGNGCVGLNINLSSNGVEVNDIVYTYFIDTTPGGLYIQPVLVTNPASIALWLCNSLNQSRTAPAQTLRFVVMRL